MLYIHWILLVIYLAITIGGIVAVLMDNKQPEKDHGMDSCALFHAYRGYHLLFVFRSEHPKGEGYQRAKYGLAYETLHAGVCRAGKSAYPSPQPPP